MSTLAAVSLVVSCAVGHSGGPTAVPAAGETTSSRASEAPACGDPTADAPTFIGTEGRQSSPGSGAADLVLVDVRVAEHERFDRVVMEFSGTGTPGWVVNYVDEAVLDGSGQSVALGGDAILDVYASGTTWPAPDYHDGARQFTPANGGDVTEVHVGGTFEGYTQVLAGIAGDPAPFRVFALTAPSRLVVDVRDEHAGDDVPSRPGTWSARPRSGCPMRST